MRTGFIAARSLAPSPMGTVIAVFDRSAYLEVEAGIVCLADPILPDGPLMVPYPGPSALRVGEKVALSMNANATWRPPAVPEWSIGSLERGLASVPRAREIHELLDMAVPYAENGLSVWLRRGFSGQNDTVPQTAGRLVGLGPGLTPSGDDYLGGMLLALRALGHRDMAAALFAALDPSRTNRISAEYLSAAFEGAAAAPLHETLHAALCGQTMRPAGLATMGHSSGRDAFAGCCLALRAYCRTVRRRPAA